MNPPKQVIVIRTDLNMRKGKMVTSGAHASLKAVLDLGRIERAWYDDDNKLLRPPTLMIQVNTHLQDWIEGLYKKVTVGVGSEQELLDLRLRATQQMLPHALILDEGLTEFGGVKTYTALAIGPWDPAAIDNITGHLKLL